MKTFNNKLLPYKSNHFKNFSILFGVLLSLVIVSSFQVGQTSLIESKSQESNIQINEDLANNSEPIEQNEEVEKNSAKYHNFLTSYFLQESSKERKSKKSEEKGQIISNLRNFRNLIISQSLSLF